MTQDNTNYGRDQNIINNPQKVILGDEHRSRDLIYGGIDPIPPSLAKQVDRTQPQAQLQQWISGRSPLVGIVGQSGFGKSVLAAWSLQQFGKGFDWARWVNCASASSFGQWAGWVLQEIGFVVRNPQWTDGDFAVELVTRLRDRRCLLVLDRLEVLTMATDWQSYADFLTDWQRRGQNSTVILTTQQEMGLAAQWLRLAGVEPEEGCLLLEQKGIVDEGEGWRSQLSEAAEGHPLLLSLAASWLRQEKPLAMVSAEDLGFFRGLFQRYRGNSEAQVGEVFADLWERLPEGLRLGLMDVSVYRIAFDEAMAELMGLTGAELEGLVEQGFLTVRSEDGRWTLHPLMARMVRNAARESGRVAAAHERAIAFFDSHRQPWTGDLVDCRSQFESFYHCCELGRYGEAYQVMATCVNVLDRQGHGRSLVPIYKQLTQAWQPADEAETQNLGWAWTWLGTTYKTLGRYQDAISAHQQAQQRFRSVVFRQGEAASLCNLGNAYDSLGQYPRAIEFLQQSLDMAREIGYRRGEAASLGNLGNAYYSLGQYPRAIEFHQQHYDIAREIGYRRGEANSLGNLGNAYDSLGQYQRAIEFHQQSLEIKREIGDRRGEANSLGSLGNAYQSLGQYPQAIEFQQQSLDIAREIGDRGGEAASLGNLGIAYYSLGQYQRAIEFHQQHYDIAREIGNRGGEAASLGNLGIAYYSLGQYQRAIEFHQQHYDIAREIGNRGGEAASLGNLGNAYYSLGQYQRAIEFQQQYYDIAREIGDRRGEANSLFNMANAFAKLKRRSEALQHYQQAQQIYAELQLENNVKNCQSAIAQLQKRSRFPWWGWFLVGVAIVLAIAWWLKG